jgi:hypothetical protein
VVVTLLASFAGLAVLAVLGTIALALVGVGYVVIGFSGGGQSDVENRGVAVSDVRYDEANRTVSATLVGRQPSHRPNDTGRPFTVTLTLSEPATDRANGGDTRHVLVAKTPCLAPGERTVVTFDLTEEQARLVANPGAGKTMTVRGDSGQLVVQMTPWPVTEK